MPLGLFLVIKIHNVFTISVTTYLNMLKFHVFSYIPFFLKITYKILKPKTAQLESSAIKISVYMYMEH